MQIALLEAGDERRRGNRVAAFRRISQLGDDRGWPPKKRQRYRNCLSPEELADLADPSVIPDDEIEAAILDVHPELCNQHDDM